MNTNRFLYMLIAIALVSVTVLTVREAVATASIANSTTAVIYQPMLGKSLNDKAVADFIAAYNCTSTDPFKVCKDAGLALWVSPNQKVETVYLYPTNTNGFTAFKGELPFGLAANDTMAMVEQKFGQPKVEHSLQAGWEPGLPDEGGTPDHIYYWAIYKHFGVTIVYNSPSASNKSAAIYAILITK